MTRIGINLAKKAGEIRRTASNKGKVRDLEHMNMKENRENSRKKFIILIIIIAVVVIVAAAMLLIWQFF